MLRVTPRARHELRGILTRALSRRAPLKGADRPALGLRLVSAHGDEEHSEFGLALDTPREGDEVLEHEGRSVLIVDAVTSGRLEQMTLDVVETPKGVRLGLRR